MEVHMYCVCSPLEPTTAINIFANGEIKILDIPREGIFQGNNMFDPSICMSELYSISQSCIQNSAYWWLINIYLVIYLCTSRISVFKKTL